MRRWIRFILIATAGLLLLGGPAVLAGSPHFIKNDTTVTVDGLQLTVSGKEAGLGDEEQVHIVLTAEAACINPGGNHPKAANKESFSSEGDFPVQNGKAEFTLTVTATFQPDCTPPMTVQWLNVKVVDETNNISLTIRL